MIARGLASASISNFSKVVASTQLLQSFFWLTGKGKLRNGQERGKRIFLCDFTIYSSTLWNDKSVPEYRFLNSFHKGCFCKALVCSINLDKLLISNTIVTQSKSSLGQPTRTRRNIRAVKSPPSKTPLLLCKFGSSVSVSRQKKVRIFVAFRSLSQN